MYIQFRTRFSEENFETLQTTVKEPLTKASLLQVGYGQMGQDSIEKGEISCEIF